LHPSRYLGTNPDFWVEVASGLRSENRPSNGRRGDWKDHPPRGV